MLRGSVGTCYLGHRITGEVGRYRTQGLSNGGTVAECPSFMLTIPAAKLSGWRFLCSKCTPTDELSKSPRQFFGIPMTS